jgi:hypothetical protein
MSDSGHGVRKDHVGSLVAYFHCGDLVLEGYDHGPTVERFFGPGIRSYDWTTRVRAEHLDEVRRALGPRRGDRA